MLDITYYDSLAQFLSRHNGPFHFFTTKAQNRYCDVPYHDEDYLVFGKETAGLPEELLVQYPQQCVRLPMRNGARSLNLSNTVAVGVYEALRQLDFMDLQTEGALTRFTW